MAVRQRSQSGPRGSGPGRGPGGPRGPRGPRPERVESEFIETIVAINRCAKVVKGGRRFSFSALVVVGDGERRVGTGLGKANEVAEAIKKGIEQAKRAMFPIPMVKSTIPHPIIGKSGAGRVMLKPASPGTGIIAGGGARAVLQAGGVRDVLTKSLGSNNPLNVVNATVAGLKALRRREEIERLKETGRRVTE